MAQLQQKHHVPPTSSSSSSSPPSPTNNVDINFINKSFFCCVPLFFSYFALFISTWLFLGVVVTGCCAVIGTSIPRKQQQQLHQHHHPSSIIVVIAQWSDFDWIRCIHLLGASHPSTTTTTTTTHTQEQQQLNTQHTCSCVFCFSLDVATEISTSKRLA